MNFSWYDCWPLLAMAALVYGAILAKGSREWCARREARRRARALCAQDKHDLTGCIQRAGMKNCDPRNTPTTRKGSSPSPLWGEGRGEVSGSRPFACLADQHLPR